MNVYMTVRCAACALAALLLAVHAAPLAAQRPTAAPRRFSVSDALARFEQEHRMSRPGTRGGLASVYGILNDEGNQHPASVDSVIAGLENLTLFSDYPSVRAAAASYLGFAGQSARNHPRVGTVARMRAAYRRSSDPGVRALLVGRMSLQAERPLAISFLSEILTQAPASTEGADELPLMRALEELSNMGEEGRSTLRRLHQGGRVRSSRASGYLQYMSERGFRSR